MQRVRYIIYLVTAVAAVISILIIVFLLYSLYKYKIKAIQAGLEDEEIKEEYLYLNKRSSKIMNLLSTIFSTLLFVFFGICLVANMNGNFFSVPLVGKMHVVVSGSMSNKNETNKYLIEHNLNNQFDVFDIIIIDSIENDKDLELYDVVVYKNKNDFIVHRIVDVVDKDGETLYVLRGDANNANDKELVRVDQILGKYCDSKIPFVGLFVVFLQSSLGYIAIGLVFIMELYTLIIEKRIYNVIEKRLLTIGFIEK